MTREFIIESNIYIGQFELYYADDHIIFATNYYQRIVSNAETALRFVFHLCYVMPLNL